MSGEVNFEVLDEETKVLLREALERGQGGYTEEQERALFDAFETVMVGIMILDAVVSGYGLKFEGDQIVLVEPEAVAVPSRDAHGSPK